MKKTLLLLVAVSAAQLGVAQEITNEDFSGFTIGNLGTDITGVTPGQMGYLTFASNGTAPTTTTNAGNDNFQIVDVEGDNGLVLQVTGPNGNKGSRFAWQEGLADVWISREDGNEFIEVEFDLYTGAFTTSKNQMRVVIYDAANTTVLAGFSLAMDTKVISGIANYDASAQPGGTIANYLFFLGDAGTPLTLDEDAWVRVGMSFNYETGQVIWRGPGFNGFVIGAAAAVDPAEIDIIAVSGTTTTPAVSNTASSAAWFDNIITRITAEDTVLGVATPAYAVNQFAVYPNPSNDVVNINVNGSIMNSAEIVDLNGRVVKSVKLNGVSDATINVADLASGVYMLNVSTENGKLTRKVVKN